MRRYARDMASAYREGVSEAQDMLNVLTNGISWVEIGDEKIKAVQEKALKYCDNPLGYGDFFRIWLDTVKVFY